MAAPKFSEILARTAQALKRDAQVLSPVAGLFIFVPMALLFWLLFDSLLVPADGQRVDPAAIEAFMKEKGLLLIPLSLIVGWGQLIVVVFLADPEQPTAGGAIMRALKIMLPYTAVLMLIQIVLQLVAAPLVLLGFIGQILFLGLALFLTMRIFLFGPALAARGRGAIAALKESWRLSGGGFWKIFLPFVGGLIVAGMLGMIGLSLIILPVGAFLGEEVEIALLAMLLGFLLTGLSLYGQIFAVSSYRAMTQRA